jgi:hypothetical protein
MMDNKKAAGVSEPRAASKSFCECHFNPIINRIKAAIYRLAPWLALLGALYV